MDFVQARKNMVETQVKTNKVTAQLVIDALLRTPREIFVPQVLRSVAYVDEDLPLGEGRSLIEPMILGRLLQAAAIKPEEMVAIIAAGTGYSAAIAGQIASSVVAIDDKPDWFRETGEILSELGISNVATLVRPLREGCAEQSPFQVIFIDGGVEEVPDAILRQLAEGGRLLTIKMSGAVGRAVKIMRLGGEFIEQYLFDASVPVIPAFKAQKKFVF